MPAHNNWQIQDEFWNSFGVPAYDESVLVGGKAGEQEIGFPHITYEAYNGVLHQTATINASLWDRNTSWKRLSDLADTIKASVVQSPIFVSEGGYYWIKMPERTPFAQRLSAGEDAGEIKRIVLTIEAESLSN